MSAESKSRRIAADVLAFLSMGVGAISRGLSGVLGGRERMRVIVILASVLGLAGADAATIGSSATALKDSLNLTNTDIGLLVTVTALVGAIATLPFGVLADRVRRTTTLGLVIFLWAGAMLWSATVPSFGHQLTTCSA